jgi:hypothetical protein
MGKIEIEKEIKNLELSIKIAKLSLQNNALSTDAIDELENSLKMAYDRLIELKRQL